MLRLKQVKFIFNSWLKLKCDLIKKIKTYWLDGV